MRTIATTLALCLASFPVLAGSNSGGLGAGEIACERDADSIGKQIDSQAARFSPEQLHQLRQQLDVARSQCKQGLNDAAPTLSRLRQQLAAQPESPSTPGY